MTFHNVVVIRHKVANYRKWRAIFDAHEPARAAEGCQSALVFRRADDPKEVVVMLAWNDLGKARQFVVSDDLQDMLAEAGVSDQRHEVFVIQELEQRPHSRMPERPTALTGPSRVG